MSQKPALPEENDYILGPEPAEQAPAREKRPERVRRSPSYFAKVEMQWLLKPHRAQHWFRPRERLLLYVLFRSKQGQRGVRMTAAVSAELGLSDRTRQRCIQELVELGAVRVEPENSSRSLLVVPLVHAV